MFKNAALMCKMVQKMRNASATVIHIHLNVYIEKQWKRVHWNEKTRSGEEWPPDISCSTCNWETFSHQHRSFWWPQSKMASELFMRAHRASCFHLSSALAWFYSAVVATNCPLWVFFFPFFNRGWHLAIKLQYCKLYVEECQPNCYCP